MLKGTVTQEKVQDHDVRDLGGQAWSLCPSIQLCLSAGRWMLKMPLVSKICHNCGILCNVLCVPCGFLRFLRFLHFSTGALRDPLTLSGRKMTSYPWAPGCGRARRGRREERGSWALRHPSLESATALTHHWSSSKGLQYPRLPQHGSSHFRADANGQVTHFSQSFPPEVRVAKTHITTAFRDLGLLSFALFWMKGILCQHPMSLVP